MIKSIKQWWQLRKEHTHFKMGYRWAYTALMNGWATPRSIQLAVPDTNQDYRDGAIKAVYDLIKEGRVNDDTL